jgi:hypothetical protein
MNNIVSTNLSHAKDTSTNGTNVDIGFERQWRTLPVNNVKTPPVDDLLQGRDFTLLTVLTQEELSAIHDDFQQARIGLPTCFSGTIVLGEKHTDFKKVVEEIAPQRLQDYFQKVSGGEVIAPSLIFALQRGLVIQNEFLSVMFEQKGIEFIGSLADVAIQVEGKKLSKDVNNGNVINGTTQILHTHYSSPEKTRQLNTDYKQIIDLTFSIPLLGDGTVYYDFKQARSRFANEVSLPATIEMKEDAFLVDALKTMQRFEERHARHRKETRLGQGILIQPKLPHRAPSNMLDNKKQKKQISNLNGSEIKNMLSYVSKAPLNDRIHLTIQYAFGCV